MRERFYSDPRIGQSKNTALEIVTRNRAHFSRELRASCSRSGPTYRAILPVLWRHPVTGEPVNRVLEVDLDGDEVTLTFYDLPSA